MSDLVSSLLIFTIIKTILSTFFFTVSNFYKNLVKWVLTERVQHSRNDNQNGIMQVELHILRLVKDRMKTICRPLPLCHNNSYLLKIYFISYLFAITFRRLFAYFFTPNITPKDELKVMLALSRTPFCKIQQIQYKQNYNTAFM